MAELDDRGLERATVVGHSLGGAAAAWLAAHHPDRVARLVLAAPAVVAGADDRIVPVSAARRLVGQIPGAKLVILEHAGHLLPLQNPERLAAVVAGGRA
jgi:pimeloyl-ACP methyl ester carboxylesterase